MIAENNGKRKISYYYSIIKDLGLPDKPSSLKNI
jgi:hypothetical protein